MFLGKKELEKNLLKTAQQPCGRGRTLSGGGQTDKCVAWDVRKSQRGQVGPGNAALGSLTDSIFESLWKKDG